MDAAVRKALERDAAKIATDRVRKVPCNLGGCDNHSGHEYCSIDAAWEHHYSAALDELLEEQEQEESLDP